jgi:hypothetical protein
VTVEGWPITLPAVPIYIFFQIILYPSQAYGKCKVMIERTFKVAVMVPPALCPNLVVPPIHDLWDLGCHRTTTPDWSPGPTRWPTPWVDLMKTKLDRELDKYYLRCVFEIACILLKEAFIGEVEDLSVQMELEKCTQQCYNPLTRHPEELMVVRNYKEFSNFIMGAPYDIETSFPFEIGAIFFNGMKITIKNVI